MNRHPPTSNLQLQHPLELRLIDTNDPKADWENGKITTASLVASTPVTLTIHYHWESTDNGHPTPSSPAWSPAAAHKQWWVPVLDHITLAYNDGTGNEEPLPPDLAHQLGLDSDTPLFTQLLSTLDPRDFSLPPLPPLPPPR